MVCFREVPLTAPLPHGTASRSSLRQRTPPLPCVTSGALGPRDLPGVRHWPVTGPTSVPAACTSVRHLPACRRLCTRSKTQIGLCPRSPPDPPWSV